MKRMNTARYGHCVIALILVVSMGCQDTPPSSNSKPATQNAPPAVRTLHPAEPQTKGSGASEAVSVDFLHAPIAMKRFETAAEALPAWRQFAKHQPTLLLLAGNPMLAYPPDSLGEQIAQLAATGSREELALAGDVSNPAQIMHPAMAVDAALRNHWFKSVVWAMPIQDPAQALDLTAMKQQFLDRRMMDAGEAATLSLDESTIKGIVRNIPFTAGPLSGLKDLSEPIILHIDLGYFQNLYKNDIATPVFDIVYQVLRSLRDMNLNVQAVTFSHSHKEYRIALDVRFLGEVLSTLTAQPDLLDKPLPVNWQRQADALYLVNFFQEEQAVELFLAQLKDDPEAAWIKFNLFRSAANRRAGEQALQYLAEAVKRDPAYAFEYRDLAKMAYERNRPDEALRMLSLASQAQPSDPSYKIRIAELALEKGDQKTASHLLEQLLILPWSEIYHPGIAGYLAEMLAETREKE